MADVVWVESKDELDRLLDIHHEVVVDFTAPSWCVPCKRFAPTFDEAATKHKALFVAVDVDKNPWAQTDYKIQGVPTIRQYVDGDHTKDLKPAPIAKFLADLSV